MPEPVTTAVVLGILGNKALDLIEDAAKGHVKAHLARLFSKAEDQALGRKEVDALQAAYENVLAHAYQRALQALGNVLNPVVNSGEEWAQYRNPVEKFLQNEPVAEHLLETVRDLSNDALPDPRLLEREWLNSGGFELPIPLVWDMVAAYFRKGARDRTFVTPDLREVLNAQNIEAIRALGEKLVGVQITVKQEQYASRMQKKYAAVELANVAPAYTEDVGVLVVSDVFEPQHVRENPPPVEITKEELEKLAGKAKRDGTDGEDLIALLDELDEDAGQNAAERLKFQRASYAEQPVRPVLDVICRKDKRLIVLTGEPGAGKSILMRYLLLGILNPSPSPGRPHQEHGGDRRATLWTRSFVPGPESPSQTEHHFPLLIELRDYYFTCRGEPDINSFLDYVEYLGESQGYGINREWLHRRLEDGPSLLLFDGLDEIFDRRDRDGIMQQIVGITETYPKAHVIVTSRPHGYHEGILRPAGFAHFRLQDLDRDQKESFTRAWFARVFPNAPKDAQQRIERVLGSVDRSPSVRWLAGNPLLLTIMCLIAREKELPRERARFYEQCIDVLVHHWKINKHLREQDNEKDRNKAVTLLDEEDKKDLLRRIAFRMQGSQAGLRGNFIGERELLDLTQKWFEETYPDLNGLQTREAAKMMVTGLWERNYLLCPRGPKLYGFLHRTFMEFLTATEYVRRFQKTPDFELDDLDAVFREHGNDPEWSEVLRLICGEIGDEFADPLIRTLLILKELPNAEFREEDFSYHLIIAVRCFGDLRSLPKQHNLGALVLTYCARLLMKEYEVLDTAFAPIFVSAIAEVGDRWPSKEHFDKSISVSDLPFLCLGELCIPEIDGLLFRDSSRIIRYLRTPELDSSLRLSSYRAFSYVGNEGVDTSQSIPKLLIDGALNETLAEARAKALELLAGDERWADEPTRQLLSQRAVNDESNKVRAKALELLAGAERWADEPTRQLLSQCAVNDEDPTLRAKALELLAGDKQWADEATRQLLNQRAVNDEHSTPCKKAMELLSGNERWADEATRQFLIQRAINDTLQSVRSKALELLAGVDRWADHEETQRLFDQIRQSISTNDSPELRGCSACAYFGGVENSDPLSDAKKRVFSRDVDGLAPYFDPRELVSDEHLAKVTARAELDEGQLEEMVQQMNETLGWDIRQGWPGND